METRAIRVTPLTSVARSLIWALALFFLIPWALIFAADFQNQDNCSATYPAPVIKYDHTDAEGWVYISVENWAAYPQPLFRKAPDLPPCGTSTIASRTVVDIYDADNLAKLNVMCAFNSNTDLKRIWFKPSKSKGQAYIIINDRACSKLYKSNVVKYGDCWDVCPTPLIEYDHTDYAAGTVCIRVKNWGAYAQSLFRQAPELHAAGESTIPSRTWVSVFEPVYSESGEYGKILAEFSSFGSNTDLKLITFKPRTLNGLVYIVISDRVCKGDHKSNILVYSECGLSHPDPTITYDHTDGEGRVYISVQNWGVYPDEMFRKAPELPPCGLNKNSSRTWIDIYDGDRNTDLGGNCGISSNEALKTGIWFSPGKKTGRAYIIMHDRACDKKYKSNTVTYGECAASYPNPTIVYDHTDAEGRVYISISNWNAYPNEMFRKAPELPPCGLNKNSSRTWIDTYDGDRNTHIGGDCGISSSEQLKGIWFSPGTKKGRVYIIMHDRACDKNYKSNTISWP